MKKIIALVLVIACTFTIFGCGAKEPAADPVAPRPSADQPFELMTVSVDDLSGDMMFDTRGVTKMSTSVFDERLLEYIADNKEGNYMVSPVSFRYALGMLLAGAEGKTKDELLAALGVTSVEEWEAYAAKLNGFRKFFADNLNREVSEIQEWKKQGWVDPAEPEPFRAVRIVNSIWKRDDIEEDFKQEFKDKITRNYGAEYYQFNRENVVGRVNAWSNEKTEGMIKELLPQDYNADDLAIVLMNALYFKDSWETEFYESDTKDDEFTTIGGKKVTKAFMNATYKMDYYADDATQIVILPMNGGVNMAYVLGDTNNIADKISKCQERKVILSIPKLDVETSFNNSEFKDFLKANGVRHAFDKDMADFSAMIDHPVYVDDIIQKTHLKTDEKGVEAAAVTAIMVYDCAMFIEEPEPVEFKANKQFSFYIYATADNATAMLFAGEIVE